MTISNCGRKALGDFWQEVPREFKSFRWASSLRSFEFRSMISSSKASILLWKKLLSAMFQGGPDDNIYGWREIGTSSRLWGWGGGANTSTLPYNVRLSRAKLLLIAG